MPDMTDETSTPTTTTTCLFCKIVAAQLPVTPVLDNADVMAFADIAPQAPHHYLVIPKTHVASLAECNDPALLGAVLAGVKQLAQQLGLQDYRTVINTGAGAGQSVFHLHAHLLAGRSLAWPPG
jgi:histidine triad (HIT) family protein